MNEKQFSYVRTLAECSSFSKAADVLNVSQPSLSQFIRRVEKEQDIVLFDRTGNDLKLTDAGEVYLETGKRILDMERQMRNKFSDLRSYNSGSITVGIAPTRCQYLMPEIVKRFALLYPGMHIEIEERFLGTLLDDAEHGAFDLCVATLPIDDKKFSNELMMQEEVVLAVPTSLSVLEVLESTQCVDNEHLYPVVDIECINGASYVSLSDTQPTQIILNDFCDELGLSIKTAVKCMSIETQFSMVKSGIGLALIPSSLAKYSQVDNVKFFSVKQSIPLRKMVVVYRKGQYLSKPIIALKEIMVSI